VDGLPLRHAVEVRHPSFACPEFVALAAEHRVPIVHADSDDYPVIADVTGDFVYARLQRGSDDEPHCYRADHLDLWAARAKAWSGGGAPEDLPCLGKVPEPGRERPVFLFFIHNGKIRAPAAAQALIERIGAG
jgi:uncharacterized protein YecE (DUF72 family)